MDDRAAYEAIRDALEVVDVVVAHRLRRTVRWTTGDSLGQGLAMPPDIAHTVLDETFRKLNARIR